MKKQLLQDSIAWILNSGTALSLLLVTLGGFILLYKHGHQPIDSLLLPVASININISSTLLAALQFSPINLIQLGLFVLVGTQILRVFMLAIFYLLTKDIWFACFSIFILGMMITSFYI